MAFCTECGAEVPADVRFCTGCGNPMGEAARPVPVMTAASAPAQAAVGVVAPTQTSPVKQPTSKSNPVMTAPNSDAPPAPGSRYAVMSTGAYIGTILLFCIPVIGWLACIIMAFAANNKNRRNFSRAMLVFLIACIVLSVVLYFVFSWAAEAVMQYINEATGDLFGEFDGLGDLFNMINGAGIPGK